MSKPIVILGCTASGKSDLAEALALRLAEQAGASTPLPIMAVDSMQVYRGMDIGTAKPTAETRAQFPYLMLDMADPWEAYSAARFIQDARPHLENTKRETQNAEATSAALPERPSENQKSKVKSQKSPPPILVAGTILYLRALIEGLFEGPSADEAIRAELAERARVEGTIMLHSELARIDPPAAAKIHPNDLRRIIRALEVYRLTGTPISTLQTQWTQTHPGIDAVYIGIHREKDLLNRRINARVKKMVEQGLVEEVRRLANDPRGFSEEAASAVGYRQLLDHFARKISLDDALEQIKIQTRYLAKMQRTWLKRWPPPGQVHWLTADESTTTDALVERAMSLVHTTGSA